MALGHLIFTQGRSAWLRRIEGDLNIDGSIVMTGGAAESLTTGDLTVQDDALITGDLNVDGAADFDGAMDIAGALTLQAGGAFAGTFTGAPTFSGAVVFSGAASFTGSPVGIPRIAGGVITELDGDGTYSISVTLPAGALLVDVIVTGEALWTAGTSATLIVGDSADPDGFVTGVDAKTTPAVGTSLRFDTVPAGTGDGAYLGDTNGEFVGPAVDNFGRYYKAGSVITATVTKSGSGTAGRTWFHVVYAMPQVVAQVVA